MTNVNVAFLVTDANKTAAIEACGYLTPDYGLMSFMRAVVPASPPPDYLTPITHWRMADETDQSYAVIWQSVAKDGALPDGFELPPGATMTEQEIIDAFVGAHVWIGNDVGNSVIWARDNMNSLVPPLVDLPPDPNM